LISLKVNLHSLCQAYIEQRIDTAQKAIAIAQASANEETKSSAGDKYETGRAMAQLEIEKNSTQLAEAHKLKAALSQIKPDHPTNTVQPGSLVITNQGNFYIAISAGQLTVDSVNYFSISPASPIGSKLIGLKDGAHFSFNSRAYQIEKVY
jgi:transcription elongation GreA/GreB family factor